MHVLDLAPLAAALFAVPQFVPQLHRSLRLGLSDGVSWTWAALTGVGNAAWTVYFAWSGYWLALVPALSASSMSAVVAWAISRLQRPARRSAIVVGSWVVLVVASAAAAGRAGLGAVLSLAFVVQVTPAVWTAYRTRTPSGIAIGTWSLVLGELACWGAYGFHRADWRLTLMGITGVLAAMAMIARATTSGHRDDREVRRAVLDS